MVYIFIYIIIYVYTVWLVDLLAEEVEDFAGKTLLNLEVIKPRIEYANLFRRDNFIHWNHNYN